jgi:hypothetical protein
MKSPNTSIPMYASLFVAVSCTLALPTPLPIAVLAEKVVRLWLPVMKLGQ